MLSRKLNELERLLSALKSEAEASPTDYLALQERLFHLAEQLLQARGRTADEEARLYLLLLEAQGEALYSTPAQRAALPRLLARARRVARLLPADGQPLLRRLRAICARYEAEPMPSEMNFIPL